MTGQKDVPASHTTEYDYIFVLTYGRSGSTILMRLLNTIPHTEIRGENSNALFHLYKSIAAARRSSSRFGTIERSNSDPWFGAREIAAKSFEDTCLNAFVQNIIAPSQGMTRVGFKEINHLPNRMSDKDFFGYIEFILTSFPNARIVFNTRDAEQVARSGWFADMETDYVVEQIKGADARFVKATKTSPRCQIIDYREVTGDRAALARLFDWLGVELDEEQADACLDRKLTHMRKKQGGLKRATKEGLRTILSKYTKMR